MVGLLANFSTPGVGDWRVVWMNAYHESGRSPARVKGPRERGLSVAVRLCSPRGPQTGSIVTLVDPSLRETGGPISGHCDFFTTSSPQASDPDFAGMYADDPQVFQLACSRIGRYAQRTLIWPMTFAAARAENYRRQILKNWIWRN